MKAFVFVLLCALVAVQGRYTAFDDSSVEGEDAISQNPWVVHLRIAVSTSGVLNTGIGSLIDERWVLTAASNIADTRFIWIRYGAADTLNPALVTETATVSIHPNYNTRSGENNIGLINTQRTIQSQANIAPVSINGVIGTSAAVGTTCTYVTLSGNRKYLLCTRINTARDDNAGLQIGGNIDITTEDIGTALVTEDGAQAALLVGLGDGNNSNGTYLETTDYVDWVQNETGVNLTPDEDDDDDDDDNSDETDEDQVEPDPVRVVQ